MADTGTQDKHGMQKLIDWGKGLAIALGGFLLVDQGQIFGETLPAVWDDVKGMGAMALNQLQIAYKHAVLFFQTNWRRAKWVSLIWWLIAGICLFGSMVGKDHGWSEGTTTVMRLTGIYLFAGYWYVAAVLAKPFYYGWQGVKTIARETAKAAAKTTGKLAGKIGVEIPELTLTVKDAAKLEEGALAFQRFFYTLATIVLLFGTFFVFSGTPAMAIKLMKYGVPLAFIAALSGKFGWKTESGWKLLKIGALIAFVAMILMDFGGMLFPDAVREWFSARNQSEKIAIALFAIPTACWLVGAFWKHAAVTSFSWTVTIVAGIVLAFLWIKGPIRSEELTGNKVMDEAARTDLKEVEDAKWRKKIDKERIAAGLPQKYNTVPAPAPYVHAPPAGNGSYRTPAPVPAVTPTVRPKVRVKLPEPEAPRVYTNPKQAMDDLNSDD